jgi:uncharacterized delta-60 repeat protein
MVAKLLIAAVVVLAVVPATTHAEQLDTTFTTNGRHVFGAGAFNFQTVATLPMPAGGAVSVFEYPAIPGICTDPVCIGMVAFSASGVPSPVRIRAAGLERVTAAAVDNSGRIVVVGQTISGGMGRNMSMSRFAGPEQTFDPAFGGGTGSTVVSFTMADELPTAVAIDGRDRIVVVGAFSVTPTDLDFAVVRLRPDGTLDPSFVSGEGMRGIPFDLGPSQRFDQATAVAIDNAGRILVAGFAFDSAVSRARIGLARLRDDGQYDTTFCNGGCPANLGFSSINNGRTVYYFGAATAHGDEALAIDALGDGGFLLAGATYNDSGSLRRAAIARFAAAGPIVTETLHDGLNNNAEFRSLRVVDAAGTRIVVAGNSGPNNGQLFMQAFNASLQGLPNFGNCLTGNSGFCLTVGEGPADSGPDRAGAIAIDSDGRVLFQGQGVVDPGDLPDILSARLTNTTGPRRDLIFRNGVN